MQAYPTNLVTPQWLYRHLDDPQVAIADCRFALADPELGQGQYQEGHIPGAHFLDLNRDLSSPVQIHGGRHPLPDMDQLAEKLGTLGIASDSPQGPTFVVAYDDSRFAFASRLWWLLRYMGHTQIAVLDGGFKGWQAQGYPVTTAKPEAEPKVFTPKLQEGWLVDIEYVRQHKDSSHVQLIDSRSGPRYRGEQEPIDPISGSIPGAVNYFWQAVSDKDGNMRSPTDLQAHWSDLEQAEEVIVYCGSGVTACVNLLSQTLAGRPMGKLYVGGWSDWCSYM
ncbi:MAG: sulfurtransferase [Leptolyngbyaceae cyanobacterium MO_188.B28]|nr:sulfurtransferase [Leptolyngbyaceae cyanobacterium MO_188.B28]